MPDVNQLFRVATQDARPAPGALERQLTAQRRRARNRKVSALAVAVVIVAAVALFAASALERGEEGSAPGQEVPVPEGSGLTFTTVAIDGNERSVIPVPSGTEHSDVSPDGTTVAFVIKLGGESRIATMPLDGSTFRILTSDSIVADRPRWSPDGSRLLFWEGNAVEQGGNRLMVMDADGTNIRLVPGAENPADVPADWSPDGSLILYTSVVSGGRWDLATIPATGGVPRTLADARDIDEGPGTWSPDGRMITFTRSNGTGNEVWIMDADGSGQHRLVSFGGRDAAAPEWAPDGGLIAFIGSLRNTDLVNGIDNVYVVDEATGGITMILRGIASYQTYDSRATWLPGGDAVLVMTVAP